MQRRLFYGSSLCKYVLKDFFPLDTIALSRKKNFKEPSSSLFSLSSDIHFSDRLLVPFAVAGYSVLCFMSPWASHCVFLLALFWNLWIATGHKSMWIRRLAYFKTLRTHSALTEWSVYKLFKWLDSRLLLLKCTFVTISSSADLIRFRSQSQSPIVYNWGWIEYERWIQTAWDLMPLGFDVWINEVIARTISCSEHGNQFVESEECLPNH